MKIEKELASKVISAVNFLTRAENSWGITSAGDDWDLERTGESTIEYTLKRDKSKKIRLSNLQISPSDVIDWGKPVVIEKEVKEHHTQNISISDAVETEQTISHTFSKTTSLQEAAEVGAKLWIEGHVEYKAGQAGGVEGGAKFGAEVSASYTRTWGSQETTSDTIEEKINIQGPFTGYADITRSVQKIQRTISTKPNFEFQLELLKDDEVLYKWNSFEEILQVLRGSASTDKPLAKHFSQDGKELVDIELRSINNYIMRDIKWDVIYDDVVNQDIVIKRALSREDPLGKNQIVETIDMTPVKPALSTTIIKNACVEGEPGPLPKKSLWQKIKDFIISLFN